MSEFRPCALIPTCNHTRALDGILNVFDRHDLAVIVVDDGSIAANAESLRQICSRHLNADLRRHDQNGGKGAAIATGLARAAERGFTHAVQVDADGQHDLTSLDDLLTMARNNPAAIVSGAPQYDDTAPLQRRFWRKFTTFWVCVNSLSLRLPDTMCGFRVYPVQRTLDLVSRKVRGRRMDFDIEVLVKAHWARIAIASVPVKVVYPDGNTSNFDVLRDNIRLAKMQTRLFFGMLWRAPMLLVTAPPPIVGMAPTRWSAMRERGAFWGLHLLAAVYRFLGRSVCLAAMAPVVFYFFVTGREQRQSSRDYLNRVWRKGYLPRRPGLWTSFRHFMNFAGSALDKFAAWTGNIPRSHLGGPGVATLDDLLASGKGAFVITAHLGNPEVVRAIGMLGKFAPMNVLVHTEHAQMFNRLIAEFSPEAPVRAIPVTKVGADTAILLAQAIEKGEWVVMVGDRVPVTQDGRVVYAPFLGDPAPFPQGPYVLASVLKAPVYLLFSARVGKRHDVRFTAFADRIDLPRGNRETAIAQYAAAYAKALEEHVAEWPLQWFNFYKFWPEAQQTPAGDIQKVAL